MEVQYRPWLFTCWGGRGGDTDVESCSPPLLLLCLVKCKPPNAACNGRRYLVSLMLSLLILMLVPCAQFALQTDIPFRRCDKVLKLGRVQRNVVVAGKINT
eukprot:TRINITY_DN6737_c0_g1_i1.p1 TRINITY_DN6737_c0_g1~~TRINITY_DN6737_c0_g1_i1.p1  ORF type:complete len:101 (+),score=20.11 TRINITY_DN6737_c0_g1_i1:270-572(+)